jgi:hypothetical protein
LIGINAGRAARFKFCDAEPLNFGENTAISEVLLAEGHMNRPHRRTTT